MKRQVALLSLFFSFLGSSLIAATTYTWAPYDNYNWNTNSANWYKDNVTTTHVKFTQGGDVQFKSDSNATITESEVRVGTMTISATMSFDGVGNITAQYSTITKPLTYAGTFLTLGDWQFSTGGTIAMTGAGIPEFAFSVPEGSTYNYTAEGAMLSKGSDTKGVVIRKQGKGKADFNLKNNKVPTVLGGLNVGRIIVEEGTLRAGGGGWYEDIGGQVLFQVEKGATLQTYGTHAFYGDGYGNGRASITLNGGKMIFEGEHEFNGDHPIKLNNGGVITRSSTGEAREIRAHGNNTIYATGVGNAIYAALGPIGSMIFNVSANSDLYCNNISRTAPMTVTGGGAFLLGCNIADGSTWTVNNSKLVATNGFSKLQGTLRVNDKGVFENVQNTPVHVATTQVSGPLKGRFGMEPSDASTFQLNLNAKLDDVGFTDSGNNWGFEYGTISSDTDLTVHPLRNMLFGLKNPTSNIVWNVNGHTVNFNAMMLGRVPMTLDGGESANSTFNGAHFADARGVYFGKFNVEGQGIAKLHNIAAFTDNLTIGVSANAEVSQDYTNRFLFAFCRKNIDDQSWTYPGVSEFFTHFHTKYNTNPAGQAMGYAAMGKFEVKNGQAGDWTFAGQYASNLRLEIDDVKVLNTSSGNAGVNSISLTEGWHTFKISTFATAGVCGPNDPVNCWTNGMALGFHIGKIESAHSEKYTKFCPEKINMARYFNIPGDPDITWYNNAYVDDWKNITDWDKISSISTLGGLQEWGTGAKATSSFSAKINKFVGKFYVSESQLGTWKFYMQYDKRKRLVIDGKQIFVNEDDNAWGTRHEFSWTVSTVGWHDFEITVGSKPGGGYGPNNASNSHCALRYRAPDSETEKIFHEDFLTFYCKVATDWRADILNWEPGVHGVLTVSKDAQLSSTGKEPFKIYGKLTGAGTLKGKFAFKGENSLWEMFGKGTVSELTGAAKFENPSGETFKELGAIAVELEGKPFCSTYRVADNSLGLTREEAQAIKVQVHDYKGDKYYSENFSVDIDKDGNLVLINKRPAGFVIFGN